MYIKCGLGVAYEDLVIGPYDNGDRSEQFAKVKGKREVLKSRKKCVL